MARTREPPKENLRAIAAGCALLGDHPLFAWLVDGSEWRPARPSRPFPPDGFVRLALSRHRPSGKPLLTIEANVWRRADPAEWAHVLAQALLHEHLNHVDPARPDEAWRTACGLVAAEFLRPLGIGRRPESLPWPAQPPGRDVAELARWLAENPAALAAQPRLGIAGAGEPGWIIAADAPPLTPALRRNREEGLATAIRRSVADAIEAAGTAARGLAGPKRNPNSPAERARAWFIAGYPLLAALAATFEIVEDEALCRQLDIAVAAVDTELRRIYLNPKLPWTYEGLKFVMAHELLHVGLRHEPRRQGRDPFLWNVACDYVINGWLVEMGVGEVPFDTLLLDPELGFERESAEAIYDRITRDLRLIRRLNKARTLRGKGKVDMLGNRPPAWWTGPGTDLDAFYRRALAEGLDLHLAGTGRGDLPGELVEEIRAIQHPPIPWDVRLGHWLDTFFPPLDSRRSFARASRRQAATPDIPRPVWLRPEERLAARTFGAVLDTSGSMPPRLLARALGAIASYAISREVPLVRVVQCDAGVHDMGFLPPETLLQRVEVRGRGGTVLQPAIARREGDAGSPRDAPILVITDGACDVLSIRREHAFLMPEGARLPFRTAAPQFHFERPE
ncbi:VWA-like domain-containing protein [Inquilinus sp. Marseille-Q2685]|uniref:vWA domain-containing protein n=1 Tax=Inquilinus sp. Marseille-Q2685 TaxID=2866581 RepID=UPI001CE41269|nr:VWA-like domain-containing protein [Inquilinus sp. Marseille-Q2685]